MKTETVTTTGHLHHPPQPVRPPATTAATTPEARPVRRVGALDRAALHLGVALIKWGRRPISADLRNEVALNAETYEARLEAERLREQHKAIYLSRIL